MIGHGIEITTRIGCLNCDYCPQDRLLSAYKSDAKVLSLADYSACLFKIPKSVRIHFSGFCEPFLNEDCGHMIDVAYGSGYEVVVYTTLVGFNRHAAQSISKINFNRFAVHVPDSGTHYSFREFYNGLKLLIEHNIKYDFEYVTDPITRAGNVYGSMPPCRSGKIRCRENRNMQNVLLPNGDVYLCCMDYGLKHRLGNLLAQSYESLFESETYKRIISGMSDDSIDILCRKCERAYND